MRAQNSLLTWLRSSGNSPSAGKQSAGRGTVRLWRTVRVQYALGVYILQFLEYIYVKSFNI